MDLVKIVIGMNLGHVVIAVAKPQSREIFYFLIVSKVVDSDNHKWWQAPVRLPTLHLDEEVAISTKANVTGASTGIGFLQPIDEFRIFSR
jgi:hypothetical protein